MIKLIEIFDAVTGDTLFYVRLIPYMKLIEIYMSLVHPEIVNYDYEIVS